MTEGQMSGGHSGGGKQAGFLGWLRRPWSLALVTFIACSPNPIDIGPDILVGGASLTQKGNEPAVAFVPGFTMTTSFGTVNVPPSMIYMFNGIGTSISSYTSTPPIWTNNSGSAGLPFAPTQSLQFGDPQIAAFPSGGGIVAAAALGGSPTAAGPDQVVLWTSTTGGTSFNTGVVVNSSGTCGGVGTATSQGAPVDQPSMAIDLSDPTPTVYFAWRYNGGWTQLNSTYGVCMRAARINPTTGAVTFISAETPVANIQTQYQNSVGGVIILPSNNGPAGFGTGKGVTIVYSYTDQIFDNCPPTAQMKWYSVHTNDTGQNWTSSTLILDSQTFAPCSPGNRYIRAFRGTFGASRDSLGNLWAALSDSADSAQIFTSNNDGQQWNLDSTAVFPGVLFPTMQTDDSGRVALFFYGATNDPNVQHNGTDVGSTTTPLLMDRRSPSSPTLPGVWTEPTTCGETFASVALLPCTTDSQCPATVPSVESNGFCVAGHCVATRLLGDYEGMAFLPAASGLGTESSALNQWAPTWTSEPSGLGPAFDPTGATFGPHIHTSFDGASQ